ncbi:TonB-dependent siderophore receptor (plasmid) [Rhizobium sp. BG4]|nr:TonB-dependent siderophore receptor [Rhizobium sp. BG4]
MRERTKALIFKANLLTGAAAIGIAAAMPVLAQEATELKPITVQGDGGQQQDPTAPVKGYVAKTSATATKTGTPLVETQQSISVVTSDEIRAQGADTLGEAIGYTPGVVGEPYGSDARFDSPNIRGFDGRQSQYLNGLKMMRTAGAPAVEIYGLERLEVLRGPASVLYGQGNPGGLINMVSKRPQFEPIREIGLQIGTYDYYGAFFDVGGPVSDGSDFAYRLTGLVKTAGEQTDDLNNDRYFIAPAFTWQPDEDTKITLLTSVQHDNPDAPSGLPAALTLYGGDNKLSRSFSVGDDSFDKSNRTLTNIGYEIEHRLNDVWTFRQNMRYSNFDWKYQSLYFSSLDADGHTLNRGAIYQDENLNTYNLDNQLQAEFSTGEVDHKAVMGVDLRYFNNSALTEFGLAPSLDSANPQHGVSVPKSVWYSQDVNSELWQAGVYLQDEIKYENWRATLGLRQDWAGTNGEQETVFGGTTTSSLDQTDHKLTWRAGLSYLFDNGIAPYASYATSFDPVSGSDAAGNPLVPTTGEQYEIGVKYQPTDFDGFFSVAAFDLRQKNVLTTTTVTPLPPAVPYTVSAQIGEVHVQGVELEGVASIADGLDLRAAYTYMNAEVVGGDNDGNRPDNVPNHTASLWLDYTFKEDTALQGFGVGGGVRYIGQRYGDLANTYDLSGVTLFDASIHYQKDNLKASLNFQNLADKEYVSNCGSFGCYYGDGRTVMGRVSVSW